jgi:hypothetical protein
MVGEPMSGRQRTAILVSLIGLALAAFFAWLRVEAVGFDGFVAAGSVTAEGSSVFTYDHYGYDGQFFYRLALEPFTTAERVDGIIFDGAAYRQQRIGYPLLAFLTAAFTPLSTVQSLVIVNVVAVGAMVYFGARIAQHLGRSPAFALLAARLARIHLQSGTRPLRDRGGCLRPRRSQIRHEPAARSCGALPGRGSADEGDDRPDRGGSHLRVPPMDLCLGRRPARCVGGHGLGHVGGDSWAHVSSRSRRTNGGTAVRRPRRRCPALEHHRPGDGSRVAGRHVDRSDALQKGNPGGNRLSGLRVPGAVSRLAGVGELARLRSGDRRTHPDGVRAAIVSADHDGGWRRSA